MIGTRIRSKLAQARCELMLALVLLAGPAFISTALAQAAIAKTIDEPNVSARKIFIMLFMMLGR
jgi:hypothetical protein